MEWLPRNGQVTSTTGHTVTSQGSLLFSKLEFSIKPDPRGFYNVAFMDTKRSNPKLSIAHPFSIDKPIALIPGLSNEGNAHLVITVKLIEQYQSLFN